MWSILVACVITCDGLNANSQTPPPPEALVAQVQQTVQTGSLIFSRGDCLAVKIFSRSAYTHVGGVVIRNGEAIVYDSMNGEGVRKTPLVEYLRQQTPSHIHIVHPKSAWSAETASAFEQHLEKQLGRTYAVKHHMTGQRCDGLHCSEYMTDALMAAQVIMAKNPPRVSPGSLREGVLNSATHREGERLELAPEDPAAPVDLAWYQRAWRSTATCCSKSAVQMRRWIVCR